ncbi:MAG TPA: GGDEF domain-containing protein [Myxococcales bacterium]|nr:GGDEF domain-containing protein [Myxococcales bacterium]
MVNEFDSDDKTQVRSSPSQTAMRESGKNQTACLIVISGKAVGKMFKLDGPEMIIGRGQDCQIQLEDDGVSRKHAKVTQSPEGTIRLVDLASTNGTWCDGTKIDTHVLKDGEKVQIGNSTILKFSYQDDLDEAFQRQLYESATRDGLTKLYNKKFFSDRMRAEFSYAVRHQTPLTLVMLDIDFFKKINDTFGHLAGDFVLAKLAQVLVETLRGEDIVARYGGEEFGMILRECPAEDGRQLAERVRRRVETTVFDFNGVKIPVTLSLGYATLISGNYQFPEALLEAADENLYKAKRGGRNRVEPHV